MACNGFPVHVPLGVGQKLVVEVECVFDGGVVVCYKPNCLEAKARGALLVQPALHNQPMVKFPRSDLANPLSLTRDHPYADLKNYARHLSVDIPHCILSSWDSPREKRLHADPRPLGQRKASLLKQMLDRGKHSGDEARFCKWRANERFPEIVEVSVPPSPPSSSASFSSCAGPGPGPGPGRSAKRLAVMRIRSDLEYLNSKSGERLRTRNRGVARNRGMARNGGVTSRGGVASKVPSRIPRSTHRMSLSLPVTHPPATQRPHGKGATRRLTFSTFPSLACDGPTLRGGHPTLRCAGAGRLRLREFSINVTRIRAKLGNHVPGNKSPSPISGNHAPGNRSPSPISGNHAPGNRIDRSPSPISSSLYSPRPSLASPTPSSEYYPPSASPSSLSPSSLSG